MALESCYCTATVKEEPEYLCRKDHTDDGSGKFFFSAYFAEKGGMNGIDEIKRFDKI